MDSESRYAIHQAARDGNEAVFESLLSANPKLAKLKDEDGRLPIHWAASANKPGMVLLLSQAKEFDVDAEDDLGWTPFMIAASLKDGDALVDLLLQRGADVNHKNHAGQTAMHFVVSKNNLDLARKLLEHKPPASARVRDSRGQYAIHRAAASGSVAIVELLIKNRSPVDASDSYGQTPFHHAVAEGNGATAVALLKAGADPTKKDKDGFLPVQLAPDKEVRKYIESMAEREGIDL